MEDIIKLSVGIVVLIVIVIIIAAAGTVLLVIAAAVGVGWLIVMGVKRWRAHLNAVRAMEEQQRLATEAAQRRLFEHKREEKERKLLAAAQEQESLAAKLQEDAERQEQERQEAERQEQERIRRREEEAARERLEAEQHKVTQLAPWSSIINCPTPQQADEIVGKASSMHSHTGKFLHVMALVGQTGVIVTWKVHTAETSVPQVIGLRDGTVMFSGWAYAGHYSTRLPTGRYALSFVVNQAGRPKDETDLSFEIVIPDGNAAPNADQFKQAVDATTQDFIKRTKTVAKAKRKVKQTLAAQGTDPDEIDGELGKLEIRLKDLDGTA